MSFHRQTHSHRSNGQRRIVGRGQGQEQPVQLFALRASPRLDEKRRRPRTLIRFGVTRSLPFAQSNTTVEALIAFLPRYVGRWEFLRLSAKLTAASREGSAFRYGTYAQRCPSRYVTAFPPIPTRFPRSLQNSSPPRCEICRARSVLLPTRFNQHGMSAQ